MVTRDSRGQTILIMAILFAVIVLTTVILLNTLHAPANVQTQSQSSGLEDVELTEAQVANDMERLFLVHTSVATTGEPLPYVEADGGPDSRFGDVVENTSDLDAALRASESGAVVRVRYNATRSQEGMLVRQNDSTREFTYDGYSPSDQNWTVLDDAEGLPRFSMNVTEAPDDSDSPFEVVVDGGNELTFDDDGVEGAGVDCELSYPIQVDATAGIGTISNETEVCGTFDLEPPDSFDLTFENGSEVTGTYTVSGVDADAAGSDIDSNTYDWQHATDDDVIVNPAFDVQYTEPAITHNATIVLYDEGSQ